VLPIMMPTTGPALASGIVPPWSSGSSKLV
jgi:hypothetical protein